MKNFFQNFLLLTLFCCLFFSHQNFSKEKSITGNATGSIKQEYCCEKDSQKVYLFTLKNQNGLVTKISNYAGAIYELDVPGISGKKINVVLGLDSLQKYLLPNPHFGALIGRFSNRIANAKFTLYGVTYDLTKNSRGKHCIHGGKIGFDKIVWDADTLMTDKGPSLILTHLSPDGHEGFPGNLNVKVIYTLTNDNSLSIDYFAETDKPTVVNFTNHCYFNLNGEGSGNVLTHKLMINADHYTPTDSEGIPTGEIKSVANTPFDFRKVHSIGKYMNQLKRGYDINYVFYHPWEILKLAAEAYSPESGIIMAAYTTEPGMQFFTANGLNGKFSGQSGRKYESCYGFCLETEHFPDSPNEPEFPSTVLRPGEKFHSTTIFKFSVKKE